MVFLFLEILIGFPISLEHEPLPTEAEQIEKKAKEKAAEEEKKKRDQIVEDALRAGKVPPPEEKKEVAALETQQKMQGVHLVESRKGSRDWELFSEAAENTQGAGAWKLAKVRVLFYNNDRVDFIVTGDRGNIEGESKNLRIEGNVVTKSSNGYTFESNSVIYQSTNRIIRSPDAIRMIGPPDEKGKGLVLTGQQMEAWVDENLMKIHEKVVANKTLNDGKQFQIKSRSAEFSGKSRLARFIENVSIEVGSMKMEGPEANFEYRPGADILQSVLVKGGVKVSDVDKYATSDTVKFDPEQNKFTFNGRPRVVQNNDEITGEQIVFIDGGKKVKVEKIRARMEKKDE